MSGNILETTKYKLPGYILGVLTHTATYPHERECGLKNDFTYVAWLWLAQHYTESASEFSKVMKRSSVMFVQKYGQTNV